ncbi:hypothetical protein [Aliikangiella sp. G2MR2-5]|uniref:hypothetical protein n=1 Tax=Aliikangiella sp. G2MR2-5 TaxID=2788943 RepID=UPI0018A8FBFD|nr:hypothetical protein [Aliikangiella sp. G2MR2-5]
MKIKSILPAILLATTMASATNAQNRCQNSALDDIKKRTTIDLQLAKMTPNDELAHRMDAYEILCPWQISQDFTGDRRKDWIGLVEKDGKILLSGIFSNGNTYSLVDIWEYDKPPTEIHLEEITLREFELFKTNSPKAPEGVSFVLAINRINKTTQILQWNGKTMIQVASIESRYQQG